jgi:predicted nucleotidyltransferase component of viral defense system
MKKWFELPEKEQKTIIEQVSSETGLPPAAIEKYFWVMIALTAVFNTEYADKIVFKVGTSLSKAWNIIERFSEDIDLGIDRIQFTSDAIKTKKDITRLRKAACKFVSEVFPEKLKEQLEKQGIKDYDISVCKFEASDTDPLAVELNYKSIVEKNPYLKPRVLIELSARSLK